MNLRARLVIAFFTLSVLPLGAVTAFTYTSNVSAMRDAASREAELLTSELTGRMTVLTAQLSRQFEQLIDVPPAPQAEQPRAARTAVPPVEASPQPVGAIPAVAGTDAARLAGQLGELAVLLNNVEVRGFGRGRGAGRGRPFRDGATADAPADGPSGAPMPGGRRRGGGAPPAGGPPGAPAAGADAAPEVAPATPSPSGERQGSPPDGRQDGSDDGTALRRIQIDLGPMRREMLQQLFPDRERFEQLSEAERDQVLARVNERMLGIQQGIHLLQEKATEQAADADAAAKLAGSAASRTAAAPVSQIPATPPAVPPVAAAVTPPAPAVPQAPLRRTTALSGSRMDVRMLRGSEVVGEVNAEINLPNVLAAVFRTTRRDRGEVPFAVDRQGMLHTQTAGDRAILESLKTPAVQQATPAGTVLLTNWVVVTIADPSGSGLKFGIARPLGDSLNALRSASARDAALGVSLIGLALLGIVPLSTRLTRDVTRLSASVTRLSEGDYGARVATSSTDEFGRLASAFNQMAADVERHQRAAVEQERLRRELELGRQIQADMLPRSPLRLGLTEVRGVSVPASEVGGDFFNYFAMPSGQVALVMGDVSGKGVGAALLMANLQASLRTRLSLGQDLASLARELDVDVAASTPEAVYATLFVGVLDLDARTLDYVNAGHNTQFVLRSGGGLEYLSSTGLPIGLLVGHPFEARRVALAAGDALFFYTDGCVECENPAGDMFGTEQLEQVLRAGSRRASDDLLAVVERELVRFRAGREAFDDATMMVVNVG